MEFSVRSKPATEFSERKWEGTPSKKLLDALEEKDSSEFLASFDSRNFFFIINSTKNV